MTDQEESLFALQAASAHYANKPCIGLVAVVDDALQERVGCSQVAVAPLVVEQSVYNESGCFAVHLV